MQKFRLGIISIWLAFNIARSLSRPTYNSLKDPFKDNTTSWTQYEAYSFVWAESKLKLVLLYFVFVFWTYRNDNKLSTYPEQSTGGDFTHLVFSAKLVDWSGKEFFRIQILYSFSAILTIISKKAAFISDFSACFSRKALIRYSNSRIF